MFVPRKTVSTGSGVRRVGLRGDGGWGGSLIASLVYQRSVSGRGVEAARHVMLKSLN